MANKRIQDEFDGLPTAQKRYEARHRSKRLCTQCPKPRSENSVRFCLDCSKKHADRCRAYYDNVLKIKRVAEPKENPDVKF